MVILTMKPFVQYRWIQHLFAGQTEKGPLPLIQIAKLADTTSLPFFLPDFIQANVVQSLPPEHVQMHPLGEKNAWEQLGCSQWDIKPKVLKPTPWHDPRSASQ